MEKKKCKQCENQLTGRQRMFCSGSCKKKFYYWNDHEVQKEKSRIRKKRQYEREKKNKT